MGSYGMIINTPGEYTAANRCTREGLYLHYIVIGLYNMLEYIVTTLKVSEEECILLLKVLTGSIIELATSFVMDFSVNDVRLRDLLWSYTT